MPSQLLGRKHKVIDYHNISLFYRLSPQNIISLMASLYCTKALHKHQSHQQKVQLQITNSSSLRRFLSAFEFKNLNYNCINLAFSKHWPLGPICQYMCLSVYPFVHFFRYRLNVFLSPLPEVRCTKKI